MSPPEHYGELTRLLSGLLDGRLGDAERARLEQWLRRDPQARRLLMQFVDMEVEFAAIVPAPSVSPAAPRSTSRRRRWVAVAAAALVFLGLAALGLKLAWRDGPGGSSPVLAHLQGDVRILSPDGEVRPGSAGAELRPGDALHLPDENSSARLTLGSGGQMTLSGRSSLEFGRGRADEFALREGRLEASVEPRAAGEELVVTTPGARVQVVGTRFTLRASPEETDLQVQEGRVRLTRISDGRAVEVKAGQGLLVREGLELVVRGLSEPPLLWQVGFEDGLPEGWALGEWVAGGLPTGSRGGVRAVRAPMPGADGPRAWLVVSQRRADRGLFPVGPEVRLHFTYKMTRPGTVRLGLVTRDGAGGSAREATWALEQGGALWDVSADRWHVASVPLSAFRSLPGRGAAPVLEGFASVIFFSAGDADRGLILDRIWVTRGGPGEVRTAPLK